MTRTRIATLAIAASAAAVAFTARNAGGQVSAATVQAPLTAAAESTLDAHTREVASQLRCPVCQGLSLQDSPSELSQQMRDVVRQQLAAGRTPAEVRAYFVGRYGEWILMAPEAHGFNWVVYLLPVVVLGAGAWVLVYALRRWTANGTPSPADVGTPSGGVGTSP